MKKKALFQSFLQDNVPFMLRFPDVLVSNLRGSKLVSPVHRDQFAQKL